MGKRTTAPRARRARRARRVTAAATVALAAAVGGAVVPAGADVPVAARTEKLELLPGFSGMTIVDAPDVLAVSRHGRVVVFETTASNLVFGDMNDGPDVFAYDRLDGSLVMVNRTPEGAQGDGHALEPSISDDGRFVAFTSDSTDLVADDTNGMTDVFVRDLDLGVTERVSVTTAGAESDQASYHPDISGDGNVVAFAADGPLVITDTNATTDVYVHDRGLNQTGRVSLADDEAQSNGPSQAPSVDSDGSVVAFESLATNLADPDANAVMDVFVRDRDGGTTERASVTTGGVEGDGASNAPDVSASGRYIAFYSAAKNLVPGIPDTATGTIFRRDWHFQQTVAISVRADDTIAGRGFTPSIDDDGVRVTWQNRTSDLLDGTGLNAVCEPFAALRDVNADHTGPVFVRTDGNVCNGKDPDISPDGRYVVAHASTDLFVPGETGGDTTDIYLRVLADDTFSDVAGTHPFFEPITWLVDRSIAQGYPDGSFGPTATVTRQAVAAFLFRYAGPEFVGPDTPTFSDVPTTHPFYDEIEWMVDAGLAEGYPDGTFRGGAPISRQAMAAFLHRFAGEPLVIFGPSPAFNDVGAGHPFRSPIEWMARFNIANGYADGGFHPSASITRQAAAAFIFRYGWHDRVA